MVKTLSSAFFLQGDTTRIGEAPDDGGSAACYGIPPLTNRKAWSVVENSMADERIAFANEPADVEETWKTLALRETNSPKLWMDAWLAAFALCSGLQIVTTDKAFSQFKGLALHVVKSK